MISVLGLGTALPERRVMSWEAEQAQGLPAGWIERRTGVRERPVAAPHEATSDLAVQAGARALASAGVAPREITLLLLATSTPDYLLPPSGPGVAHRLGLSQAGAVDVAGACAGFLYALTLADAYCRARGGLAMVIGANVLSRRVHPEDAAAFLFSDGAGAVVLGPGPADHGILSVYLGADGSQWDTILIPAGGSRQPMTSDAVAAGEHYMRIQKGQRLFREAVQAMVEAGRQALIRAGLEADDVDWWIPHQANRRIIDKAGEQLGFPPERTIQVIDRYGNSSAATIPLALGSAVDAGHIGRGQILLLTAVGAGMVSAGLVLRW